MILCKSNGLSALIHRLHIHLFGWNDVETNFNSTSFCPVRIRRMTCPPIKWLRLDLVVVFNVEIQGVSSDNGITITTTIPSKLIVRSNGVKQCVFYQGHRTGFSARKLIRRCWATHEMTNPTWQNRNILQIFSTKNKPTNRPSIIIWDQQCD